MNQKIQQCLMVEVENPSLEKIQVGRTPVKEGKGLPNSITEDVGGFSLCPTYSGKQLRRIRRLRIRQAEILGNYYLQTLKNGGRLRWWAKICKHSKKWKCVHSKAYLITKIHHVMYAQVIVTHYTKGVKKTNLQTCMSVKNAT